jgi:hypothetical protein
MPESKKEKNENEGKTPKWLKEINDFVKSLEKTKKR